ncbi:glutathione S-transferase N-terminal domain-containing protein [Qipengyuania sp. CAU 1752]
MARMYRLYGALASPYSMKMRSLLRYRWLPFIWHDGVSVQDALAKVRAPVIPVLEFPDGHFANDSTPLVYELEELHQERGVVPPDPAIAFLAHLIEDFADEWLTKAMFGWRWLAEVDQVQMSRWLAFDRTHGGGLAASQAAAKAFRERQVGRMGLVGCTRDNFPLIEASTHVVLQSLESHVTESFFLFGSRPSLAEFGLLGQLSQLATDPTPQSMMREHYPYTYRWLAHLEDLSGHTGEWANEPSAAALRIAQVAGAVYASFLVGNQAALNAGEDMLRFEALGHTFSQPVFKYQAKCLADLRGRYMALSEDGRARVSGWAGDSWRKALET